MAWCKRDVSDFFRWNFFSFKSAWIFACAFQLSSTTFPCIFFAWFALCFWEKQRQNIEACTMNTTKQNKSISARKMIQENVFLLNWKAHAKIQALLKEKKFHLKKSLASLLHQAIRLAANRLKEKLTWKTINSKMNLINSTSGGITCLSLFSSHRSETWHECVNSK